MIPQIECVVYKRYVITYKTGEKISVALKKEHLISREQNIINWTSFSILHSMESTTHILLNIFKNLVYNQCLRSLHGEKCIKTGFPHLLANETP